MVSCSEKCDLTDCDTMMKMYKIPTMVNDKVIPIIVENDEMEPAEVRNNFLDFAMCKMQTAPRSKDKRGFVSIWVAKAFQQAEVTSLSTERRLS